MKQDIHGARSDATTVNAVLSWHDYAEALLPARIDSYLDYGCGKGEMLNRVYRRAAHASGLDVDPEVLPSIPGVETRVVREGESLPFPNESFDVITCLEVIEHVADAKQTLRELARVLRPGGILILTTPYTRLAYIDGSRQIRITHGIGTIAMKRSGPWLMTRSGRSTSKRPTRGCARVGAW